MKVWGLFFCESRAKTMHMIDLTDKKILLIISGGIAAYKALELIRLLKGKGAEIQCILTKGGAQFITPLSVSALTGEKCYTDLWDLNDESEMGHIRLSRDNDLIVVAPASADIMAKIAHGLADDLASTTLLACNKPVMIAPAMNPAMWENTATQANIETLRQRGFIFSGPESGDMACGETGLGRLRAPEDILQDIQSFFLNESMPKPLSGKTVLVTAGPTYEAIDPVRFIGNHSSGKQGYAIAQALYDLGAKVTLVSGPTALDAPANINLVRVTSAKEMLTACKAALPYDIAICAAAVADWACDSVRPQKIKKQEGEENLTLNLIKNPDILKTLGHADAAHRPSLVIGFAAETEHTAENAQKKLYSKNADAIIANTVNSSQSVFGADENEVYVIDHSNIDGQKWCKSAKTEIALQLAQYCAKALANKDNKNSDKAA